MKVISSIIVVILLLCGGALWFIAGGSLNEYVKTQIETVGHQVTEQNVTVNQVDIQLAKGAGSIYGLNLPNPSQYNYPNAFTLDEITLDINIESLIEEPIVLDAIVIQKPEAFVEFTKEGNANIKELIDTIGKNLPKSQAEEAPSTKAEPKIAIKKVILAGTALSMDLSALGNKEHQATLPDITLTNIGGEQGLPASQLGSVIIKEALSEIWRHTKKVQKEKLKDKAKEKIKEKAKEKLSELFN
ncbi:DUF748 domain-containing protein [Thalassotalea hakodatensis]|uniref:DUF748 domain-containing protein n=1 Tax=Thalassotalea hakodatensis TaxID=3030492 RepID=UPI0025723462|nr:AsmA family protein [Thalassotalea hakodatensis]